MKQSQYETVLPFYWICTFKRDRDDVGHIVFSHTKPDPVDNPQMHWVKPTFEELTNYNEKLIAKRKVDMFTYYKSTALKKRKPRRLPRGY